MNILITGGSGFIGSNLIRYILNNYDHNVMNVDKLTYAGNADSLSDLDKSSSYKFELADICDQEKMNELFTKLNLNNTVKNKRRLSVNSELYYNKSLKLKKRDNEDIEI